MLTVSYSYREVCQWALVCRLNKTKFAEIFEETLKQNSPDSETSNTFRVRHIIWQHKGHYMDEGVLSGVLSGFLSGVLCSVFCQSMVRVLSLFPATSSVLFV